MGSIYMSPLVSESYVDKNTFMSQRKLLEYPMIHCLLSSCKQTACVCRINKWCQNKISIEQCLKVKVNVYSLILNPNGMFFSLYSLVIGSLFLIPSLLTQQQIHVDADGFPTTYAIDTKF